MAALPSLTLLPSHTGCVLLLSPRLTWKTESVVPFLNKSLYGSFSCLQDPERQGPPSRQGSALVNGINWSDRRSSGALPPGPAAFARSRSLPHPQDALYPDRSASLNTYLPSECSSFLSGSGCGAVGARIGTERSIRTTPLPQHLPAS